ncbi:hypothetical protein [Luteimonas granuli]|uniref:Uncharacterized protein n=1 Tax=Luteimonas granuli TaxID=1176533 RepID=A0A518N1U6_9GAMM|nr:hypothetical protein [Luteimonas granuli]QDW65878.1 hypothetical protein FPZ22_02360 [Luteimonas granuli]
MTPHSRPPCDRRAAPDQPCDVLHDALAARLRGLREEVAPTRDLWPGIAARLEPRIAVSAGAGRDRRRRLRRRNAAYATAATVVFAVAAGWQSLPFRTTAAPPVSGDTATTVTTGAAADAGAPLLQAADALAREYQGALREVETTTGAATAGPGDLDAELERSATEVRAALARDPDARHLLRHLQRIYAHRLALSLSQA